MSGARVRRGRHCGRPLRHHGRRGFALVVVLPLLALITIVSLAAFAAAVVDQRMVANVEQRERAFQAAEWAIAQALQAPGLGTDLTFASPRIEPALGGVQAIAGSAADGYSYRLYFDRALVPADAADAASGVREFHFVVEATGHAARGARDVHVQGFRLLRPAGWTADAPRRRLRTRRCGLPGRAALPRTGAHVLAAGGRRVTRHAGHSLVELCVVLALGAMLALLAVPGYRGVLLRAHRSEATAALLQVAAAQEKHHRIHGSYATALTRPPPDGLGLPSTTIHGYYAITIDADDAESWQATATAASARRPTTATAPSFTLDDAGTATATGSGCWSR